jgi:hypothetical protein
MVAVFYPPAPQPIVVMYWTIDGSEISACVWEVPGTNREDYN